MILSDLSYLVLAYILWFTNLHNMIVKKICQWDEKTLHDRTFGGNNARDDITVSVAYLKYHFSAVESEVS